MATCTTRTYRPDTLVYQIDAHCKRLPWVEEIFAGRAARQSGARTPPERVLIRVCDAPGRKRGRRIVGDSLWDYLQPPRFAPSSRRA